jgi:hypothetical protein
VKADANQFSNHKRSELRLGGPAKFLQQRSEDEGGRTEARSAQAGWFKVVTAGYGSASQQLFRPQRSRLRCATACRGAEQRLPCRNEVKADGKTIFQS